jgi:hypothetical protein
MNRSATITLTRTSEQEQKRLAAGKQKECYGGTYHSSAVMHGVWCRCQEENRLVRVVGYMESKEGPVDTHDWTQD